MKDSTAPLPRPKAVSDVLGTFQGKLAETGDAGPPRAVTEALNTNEQNGHFGQRAQREVRMAATT